MAKLATPRLEVYLSEDDESPLIVQAINADMVLGESTARRHNWGSFTDAPIKNQTFLAWAALRRRKLIPEAQTFEDFERSTASITVAPDAAPDDAGGPGGVVSPIRPDLASG